jgi:hypothetical protein
MRLLSLVREQKEDSFFLQSDRYESVHASQCFDDRGSIVWLTFAFTASDLKRADNSLARLQVLDILANRLDAPHELMSENVAFLQSDNLGMIQMEVGTANSRASHLDDRVVLGSRPGSIL